MHNAGNLPVRVRLTAVGVSDDLSFAVSPSLLELEPAQSELGLVKVRTRRPSLLGPRAGHDFRIAASLEDGGRQAEGEPEAACLGASFEQVRLLSRALILATVGAVLLAGVIIGMLYVTG